MRTTAPDPDGLAKTLAAALRAHGATGDLEAGVATLLALLDGLGWRGEAREVFEAMPHAVDAFGPQAILATLDRLGFPATALEPRAARRPSAPLPQLHVGAQGEAAARLAGASPDARRGQHPAACYVFAGAGEVTPGALRLPFVRRLVDAHLSSLVVLFALLFLSTAVTVALSLVTILIYDKVLPTGAGDTLLAVACGVLALVAFDTGNRAAAARLTGALAARTEARLSGLVFDTVIGLPYERTGLTDPAGQLHQMRELERLHEIMSGPLTVAVLQLPFTLVFVAMIWLLAGAVALVPAVGVVAACLLGWFLLLHQRALDAVASEREADHERATGEAAVAADLIRLNGCAGRWLARLDDAAVGAVAARSRATRFQHASRSAFRVAVTMTGGATLVAGAHAAMVGTLSAGPLIAVVLMTWRVVGPVQQFFGILTRVDDIGLRIRKLHRLEALATETGDAIDPSRRAALRGGLRLDRLTVRYGQAPRPALNQCSLDVAAGEMIGITGDAGSGKTTLLRSVLGLLHPSAGGVYADGVTIEQIDPRVLRRQIGYVPQRPAVFYGTLAQNIRLSAPFASDAEIVELLQALGLGPALAQLPRGIDTRVHDLDKDLVAAGLRQGVSLARALLRDPAILLLDSPADRLDRIGGDALVERIERLRGRHTILMVSHRPSHLRLADRVLVLADGRPQALGAAADVLPSANEERHEEPEHTHVLPD